MYPFLITRDKTSTANHTFQQQVTDWYLQRLMSFAESRGKSGISYLPHEHEKVYHNVINNLLLLTS